MAKKLNKTVAMIAIALVVLVIGAGAGLLVLRQVNRNPERALETAHLALETGDYAKAERLLGRAYIYGKTESFKIDRLFELAEFHLINNEMHEPEWPKAMGFWNKIITIDTENIQARQNLLNYYYQAADSGQAGFWKDVYEHTSGLMEILGRQGQEPDAFLLKAHAKALLSIARRGESTDRKKLLDDCVVDLDKLLEQEPKDAELYSLRAQAAAVQGDLDVIQGSVNAQQQAKNEIENWFRTGIEKADNTAEAVANYIQFQLQNTPDPNGLEQIRLDLETWLEKIQPNARLYFMTSVAYENPGKQSVEAETNRSIEALRQALLLEPDNFEYLFRKARLLYRKGKVFNDAASLQDAVDTAESALSLDAVQDVSGPLQSRNTNYRFILNVFLADVYLEQALEGDRAGDDEQAQKYAGKASGPVDVIIGMLGTTDGPVAQKYQGLMALVKDQQDKGVRLLYNSYQQQRSLDQPDTYSGVDPIVCIELAHMAKQANLPGMEREFLQWAIYNQNRAVLQNPQLILDYADVLGRLGAWPQVQVLVDEYHSRYRPTQMSRELAVRSAIASNDLDAVEKGLAELDPAAAGTTALEIRALSLQMALLQQEMETARQDNKEPTPEQTRQLSKLRTDRTALLDEALTRFPESVDLRLLVSVVVDLVRQNQIPAAVKILDLALAANPDNVNLKVLRLQCDESDPSNIAEDRFKQLRLDAIKSVSDKKQRALLMAEYRRTDGDYDGALEVIREANSEMVKDADLTKAEFDILIEKQALDEAEALLPALRTDKADRCEGNLVSAILEVQKENYQLAMRRLDECLTLRPLFSYPYLLKSQVQRKLGQYETAIENIQTAVMMEPGNGAYVRVLATLLFERNAELGNKTTPQQRSEAERALASAIQLNPSDWQLQSVYAESIQSQSPDRALAIRQQLLEVAPNATNALMLGNMAMRMSRGEWDDAKKSGLIKLAGQAFEKAVELEPANDTALQTLADYRQQSGQGESVIDILGDDQNLLWKFYLRNGQYERALTLIEELLGDQPDDLTLLQGMALAYEGQGDRDHMKQVLGRLYEKDDSRENQLWVLQKYIDNGLSSDAERKLTGFKERFPDEQAAYLIEAWVQMTNGYLDEAMSLTNRYLETNTDNPGAWRLRGRLYRLMSQPRKAVEDLQRSKDLQDTTQVRVELANVYTEIRQSVSAIGELIPLMDDPGTPTEVRVMLENLYKANNRTSDLNAFYQTMIQKYPDTPFWYLHAGVYYLGQRDFAKAQERLEKAMELAEKENQPIPAALDYYLETFYQSQQYDKAIAVASRYIDGPISVIAYKHMAEVQVGQNQPEKAIQSYYTAMDKAGSNIDMLDGILNSMLKYVGDKPVASWIEQKTAVPSTALPGYLAAFRLAQLQGSYNKAIEYMDKCIEIAGPESPEYQEYGINKVNLLIMGYMKTSDADYVERAVTQLKKMLELQPDNPSLLNNLAYLLAEDDQQIEAALDYARKAHLGSPSNAVYLDTYAYVQCKAGELKDAERNLLRAKQMYEVGSNPVPWDLYKHLALTYELQGKNAEALETYRKALDAAADASEKERQSLESSINKLSQ